MVINVDLYSIESINSMEFNEECEIIGTNQYIAEYLKNTLKEKGICYKSIVPSDNIYKYFIEIYPEESLDRLKSILLKFDFTYDRIPLNYQCSNDEWFHSFAYLNAEQYADSIQKLLDVDIDVKEKVTLFFNVFTFNNDENSIYFLINIFNIMKNEVNNTGKNYLQHMINYLIMYYMKIFQYVDKNKNILQYYSNVNINVNENDFFESVLKPFNLSMKKINYLVMYDESNNSSFSRKESREILECALFCKDLETDYSSKNDIFKCLGLTKFIFEFLRKKALKYRWVNNNPYIETIIIFLDQIINKYLEADMHPILYWRVVSVIYLKNSIKFRYNIDNDIYNYHDIVNDYLKELNYIIQKKYYTTNIIIYCKIIEMIVQLQTFYNYHDIDENIKSMYDLFLDEFISNLTFDSKSFIECAFNLKGLNFLRSQEIAITFLNCSLLPKKINKSKILTEIKSYVENYLFSKRGSLHLNEDFIENDYNFNYIY